MGGKEREGKKVSKEDVREEKKKEEIGGKIRDK